MRISEHLIHELLDITRQYAHPPFNAIFEFVARDSSKTLGFFLNNIYYRMLGGKVDYGWKVSGLLEEIKNELVFHSGIG